MKDKIKIKLDQLIDNKAFAVIRLDDSSKALKLVESLVEGGVKNIEVTLTSQNPYNVISDVEKEFSEVAQIGVGSVLEKSTLIDSINAGANYVVTPVFIESLIDLSHSYGCPIFSGAYSPTEIFNAKKAGADVVKVFPADIVGMKFFKAIKAPMPDLKIMPTGGVSLTNAGDWFKVGACAVGVGSALVDNKAIAEGNFIKIKENAKVLMNTINKYFGVD